MSESKVTSHSTGPDLWYSKCLSRGEKFKFSIQEAEETEMSLKWLLSHCTLPWYVEPCSHNLLRHGLILLYCLFLQINRIVTECERIINYYTQKCKCNHVEKSHAVSSRWRSWVAICCYLRLPLYDYLLYMRYNCI